MSKRILILPGDGIGPEVTGSAIELLSFLQSFFSLDLTFKIEDVGGTAFDKTGYPLPIETLEEAKKSDAILFGAVGGPQWESLDWDKRPEQALLGLRKELGLFANLRPAFLFNELSSASPIKKEIIDNLNILIVRELTGGIYFGEPRGVEPIAKGERKGVNTHVYTTREIKRVTKVAFDLAKKRNKKVTSAEKSNVMEAGMLWKEEVQKFYDENEEYKDIELSHMLADNCAMQLVRNPKQFDVIVTDNLFGDMLSDEAAMLTGSLGMLPSASLSEKDKNGRIRSMYEPCHGSAPDIAGQGVANPLAMILSFAMALKYSLDLDTYADDIDKAVKSVLKDGLRTPDIMESGKHKVSTSEMGSAIIDKLK